jgi:hypothetical protein
MCLRRIGDLNTGRARLAAGRRWQEAPARACTELLEAGIAQALWVVENLGSVLVAKAPGQSRLPAQGKGRQNPAAAAWHRLLLRCEDTAKGLLWSIAS